MPIYRFGTEEQKQRWLPAHVPGRDPRLVRPHRARRRLRRRGATDDRAVLDGDEWVINGSKAFITNSGTPISAVCTVTAITGTKPDGTKEISTIIVPTDTPGFTVLPEVYSQGRLARVGHPRAGRSTTSGCPRRTCSASAARGIAQFLQTLDDGRVAIAALAVGLAQGCLDESA